MPDVLLQVAGRLARPLDLPWKTFDEMLHGRRFRVAARPVGRQPMPGRTAQQQGGWWGQPGSGPVGQVGRVGQDGPVGQTRRAGQAGSRRRPAVRGAAIRRRRGQYPFHFLPYASQAFLDGSLAHLPWLQEMPDVISTAMWSSWVEINTQTAARLGIAEGDIVEVASAHGTLRAPALVSPGIAPDVVAMPVGQGHETFTRYASGRGENPIRILAPLTEPETGRAGVGGDAGPRVARRRGRRRADSVCRRDARTSERGRTMKATTIHAEIAEHARAR